MSSGRVQARIDPKLQRQAEVIIKASGYTVSKLVTVLYSYIVKTKELPIVVKKIPNEITLKAMKNIEKGKKLKVYKSGDEGLKALGLI